MIRRPTFLPDSEWDEEHKIRRVIDAYKHNGRRILAFLTEDQQFRSVAIIDIELPAGLVRHLQRENIAYR